MTMTIRPAHPSDIPFLGALARQTFCETFFHYKQEALDIFLAREHSEAFFAASMADSTAHLLVAEDDGEYIGYAKYGEYHLPLASPYANTGELHRLYVARAWQGKRIGAALMEHAIAAMSPRNAIYLGVWSGNIKAQDFYKRYGFEKVGEYDYPPIGEVVDLEWIMEKVR